jgi:membrane-associated phospholipid phosphatase
LGEVEISIVALVVIFNITNKMKALYIWAAFGFICFLNVGVFKHLYAQPRPFWVSENINPQKCRKDFGNPSGHCMTASFFWLTVYLHKYHEVGAIKKFNSVFCTEYIIKMMLTVGMVLFFIFLAISRVFLGEHSYNQVLFGL